jgi:hypothetical protein
MRREVRVLSKTFDSGQFVLRGKTADLEEKTVHQSDTEKWRMGAPISVLLCRTSRNLLIA